MFLQVSLTQFDCARSFIRLSPGMSLNFNFAIDFKNKIATEQKFPCVSTANGTITGFECEPFLLAHIFSATNNKLRKYLRVAMKMQEEMVHFQIQ